MIDKKKWITLESNKVSKVEIYFSSLLINFLVTSIAKVISNRVYSQT